MAKTIARAFVLEKKIAGHKSRTLIAPKDLFFFAVYLCLFACKMNWFVIICISLLRLTVQAIDNGLTN